MATLSVLDENGSLNIEETITHAENIIREGLHGVFFFGSTGQSQFISLTEKRISFKTSIKQNIKVFSWGLDSIH